MKSIMEKNQIVETLSILLYSRTLDTLYLEVFDAQTKNLISKLHINTSSQVWLNLGTSSLTLSHASQQASNHGYKKLGKYPYYALV